MQKVYLVLLILVSVVSITSAVSAEEVEEKSSIFNLPDHNGIKDNMKTIDLEEMTKKSKDLGEKAYIFLQSNSVLYLLICLGVGLVFLLFGIVFRFFRAVAGFAIFVGIIGFTLINFAPDAVNRFVHWVSNLGVG